MDDHHEGGEAPATTGMPSGTAPHAGADPVPAEAATEAPSGDRVRIVGAQPAVEAVQSAGSPPDGPEAEAVTSVPDLPPWTDPPTGQVPAVLDRGSTDVDDPWSAVLGSGPTWREHPHEWDDAGFEPALLGDEETRVGALDVRSEEDDPSPGGPPPPVGGGTAAAGEPTTPMSPSRAEDGRDGAGSGSQEDGKVRRRGRGRSRSRRPGAALRSRPGRDGAGHGDPPAEPGGSPRAPTGRNLPVAIGTGVVAGIVAIACFELGAVAMVLLSSVVVVGSAAEAFGSLRRAGYRPATLVGLVAIAGLMGATYAKGLQAVPLVTVLLLVVTMLWFLFAMGRGSAVQGIGATVTVYLWIGGLGCFAALLLAPGLFPHRHGVAFLFGAVAGVVAADVGALAVGGWLGRHRLAPTVSPNKTWEGLAGGAVLAVVVSTFVTGHIHPWTPGTGALLGVVVAVVAPLGDLCESLVKRELGLKDMGTFLPGHGGMLDRFDALLFVLPATFYLVRALNLG